MQDGKILLFEGIDQRSKIGELDLNVVNLDFDHRAARIRKQNKAIEYFRIYEGAKYSDEIQQALPR